jgi:hypothetical protein
VKKKNHKSKSKQQYKPGEQLPKEEYRRLRNWAFWGMLVGLVVGWWIRSLPLPDEENQMGLAVVLALRNFWWTLPVIFANIAMIAGKQFPERMSELWGRFIRRWLARGVDWQKK